MKVSIKVAQQTQNLDWKQQKAEVTLHRTNDTTEKPKNVSQNMEEKGEKKFTVKSKTGEKNFKSK